MYLKKWLVKTNSDGSTSDHKVGLRAAAQAVGTRACGANVLGPMVCPTGQGSNRNAVEEVKVDLRTSSIKCTHFHWLKENMTWLSQQEGALIRGGRMLEVWTK